MRKAVETTFELLNGGQQTLADWLWHAAAPTAHRSARSQTG
jgi:hypothetical protein